MVFREGHLLPTVRIQKIVMENFKSVHYGEVIFNCGRKFIPQDTEADVLGIYGQNGSGKTAVIEAIAILKKVMMGSVVVSKYAECIADGAEFAKLTFVFDFQYPADEPITRTITYSFKMDAIPNDSGEDEAEQSLFKSPYSRRVRIFDEVISASGMFNGEMQKKQDILTSLTGKYPIGPSRKIQEYVGKDENAVVIDLTVNQRTAAKESRSFIFSDDTLELFYQHSNYSEYFQVLMELNYYASNYLCAVDTRSFGMGDVLTVPFNTRLGSLNLNLVGPTKMPVFIFEELQRFIHSINLVLPSLVSGMELVMDDTEFIYEDIIGRSVKFFSKRKNTLIPLRDESAGIIKLVCILSLIIEVFNDRSLTVAIDEFDAGIYEYLLGEILSSFEMYGKGQFIFTSHNLRPLEVLKKENLIFTTSNPDNRYIRLKGVGRTNNLRKLYLDEILGNKQDEKIYDAAKRQRMIAAFMKAGVGIDEEE